MQKSFSIGAVLLSVIELSFVFFLPVPTWLSLIILLGLYFIQFFPFSQFIYVSLVIAGWIWSYIYVWLSIVKAGGIIFYMIMLLLAGLVVLFTKKAYQNTPVMQRPMFVSSKGFPIIMWSIAICAFLADGVMLIHLITL